MTKSPKDIALNDSNDRSHSVLPNHVAVIMDGNGRWAKGRGVGRFEGHQRGVRNVRILVDACSRLEIRYLTMFAFSSENWRRPQQEIQWLMRLLSKTLDREVNSLRENGVRLRIIGDIEGLPEEVQSRMYEAIEITKSENHLNLTLAINYGGRWDLTQACQQVVTKVASGSLTVDGITPELVASHLSTELLPEPDLFIRTGGEQRMSNFMLWQLAYTELYFTDTNWPDFDRKEFDKALRSFSQRVRRFGRTDDQVNALATT